MEAARTKLATAINKWNESRLDLFNLSSPNDKLEFHGIVRFYHQDSVNDGKYTTKCVRVSSTATASDVIETLSEKFRADMRMLSKPKYSLYEVHINGDFRQLADEENPLIVQLSWIEDDREGRFLLKNEDNVSAFERGNYQGLYTDEQDSSTQGFKLTRNLTKKEKKVKKKDPEMLKQPATNIESIAQSELPEISTVRKLYNEVPESTFTRTVSNPEAVMKKRREQKLQKRGAEIVKIYGQSINLEIPYKSLLLLPSDKTNVVIYQALDKYGLGKQRASDYNLYQLVLPPGTKPEDFLDRGWGNETVLNADDMPLTIQKNWKPHQGTLVFQLRHKLRNPSTKLDQSQRHRSESKSLHEKQSSAPSTESEAGSESSHEEAVSNRKLHGIPPPSNGSKHIKIPHFIEFCTGDKKIIPHKILPNVTEIGCDKRSATYGAFIELQRTSHLLPCHCIITNMDGVVTITPHDSGGEIVVGGKLISETTMLSHGDIICLGENKLIVFSEAGHILASEKLAQVARLQASAHPISRRARNSSSVSQSNEVKSHRGNANTDCQEKHKPNSYPLHQQISSRCTQDLGDDIPQNTSSSTIYSPVTSHERVSDQPLQNIPDTVVLPASITVYHDSEDAFLNRILSATQQSLHFKLSPAYCLYLALRGMVATKCSLDFLQSYLKKITNYFKNNIQINKSSINELAFWMANISEILNFVRQDRDISPVAVEAQDVFASSVQLAFRHLVRCMQQTLFSLMPAFMSESDEDLPTRSSKVVDLKIQSRNSETPTMYDILHMLSTAMSLLRRCRVNAALTIQLFSQLFHSINMWLFNKLVEDSAQARKLCCRSWGIRFRTRLAMVETWAEKQGLELAADCHLARITQATHLLQAPKHSSDDIAAISGTCFKLNSLQLRALLINYQPDVEKNEQLIPLYLIDRVVAVAENSADELTRSDGREVNLTEDPDLHLPFLLPEDGYSCDVVHGLPSGLNHFLQALNQIGLCAFTVEEESSGLWTVNFHSNTSAVLTTNLNIATSKTQTQQQSNPVQKPIVLRPQQPQPIQEKPPPQREAIPPTPADQQRSVTNYQQSFVDSTPEIITITLNKRGGGMGLSIVATRSSKREQLGIYIRSVVKDGAADLDGRLEAGDELLSVDGQILTGLSQEMAAGLMTQTGNMVLLQVAKQSAFYNGIEEILFDDEELYQRQQLELQRREALKDCKNSITVTSSSAHLHHKPPSPYTVTPSMPERDQHMNGYRGNPKAVQVIPTSTKNQMAGIENSSPALKHPYQRGSPYMHTAQSPSEPTSMSPAPLTYEKTIVGAFVKPFSSNQDAGHGQTLPSSPKAAQEVRAATHHQVSTSKRPDPNQPLQDSLKAQYKKNALDNPNYEHVTQLFSPNAGNNAASQSSCVDDEAIKQSLPDSSTVKPVIAVSPLVAAPCDDVMSSARDQDTSSPCDQATSSSRARVMSSSRDQVTAFPHDKDKESICENINEQAQKKSNKRPKKKTSYAMQKNNASSMTLPRHFKSIPSWQQENREQQEQSIQEQLNLLRDEEILDLQERADSLNQFEKERLKTLLAEQKFHKQVQEEKRKLFSDESSHTEDCVPDRPDRDRILRQQDSNNHARLKLSGDHSSSSRDLRSTRLDTNDLRPPYENVGRTFQPHISGSSTNISRPAIEQSAQPARYVKRDNSSRSSAGVRPVSDGFMLPKKLKSPSSETAAAMQTNLQSSNGNCRSRDQKNDPSQLTFKDRQRMFQADGESLVNRPKSSRRQIELEYLHERK